MAKRGRRKMITTAGEGKITIQLAQGEILSSEKENQKSLHTLECELEKGNSTEEGVDGVLEQPDEQVVDKLQEEEAGGVKKEGKTWSDLFKSNREGDTGLKLKKVIEEGEEVVITREDIEPEVRFWQFSLVAFIVGQDIPVNVMVNFLKFRWKGIVIPQVIKHEEGYFLLRFENRGDMECALSKGVQYFYSKPMMLRKWIEGVPKPEEMRVVPVWIQLPRLPLGFWGGSTLSKIASKVGEPIKTDELTAKKLKIEYARVLVNIEVGKELPETVDIKSATDGYKFTQEIKYEWLPVICKKCKKWGHREEKCRKPSTMQWQVKKKADEEEKKDKQGQIIIGKEEVPIPAKKEGLEEQRRGRGREQDMIKRKEYGKEKVTFERGSAEMLMSNLLQMLSQGKDMDIGEPSRPPDL